MAKKMTKKDYFTALLAVADVQKNDELVSFINHEIELLNKKSVDKAPTKTQVENEKIKEQILAQLGSEPKTIAQIQECEDLKKYSNQKISALLKRMIEDTAVERIEGEKGKAMFKLR